MLVLSLFPMANTLCRGGWMIPEQA